MRWFKHMSNSAQDEKLVLLQDRFGLEGYGFFWRILEIIAAKIDEKNINFCTYPESYWRKHLNLTPKKFAALLDFCRQTGLFFVDFSSTRPQQEQNSAENSRNTLKNPEGLITIGSANILKYKDEYTTRQGRKSPGSPELIPTKNTDRTEPETEAEAEIKAGRSSLPGASGPLSGADDPDQPGARPEAAPLPDLPYAPEIISFVQHYQEQVQRELGKKAPPLTSALLRDGCDALDKLMRLDKYGFNEIRQALTWGRQDPFFRQQLLSLGLIRQKWKNGNSKFANLLLAYEAKAGLGGALSSPALRRVEANRQAAQKAGEILFG